jgi:predicted DNA-binding protein
MESKKTTTISFRIDDKLKNLLSNLAERENKTITVKAKEALIEYLKTSQAQGIVKNTNLEMHKMDLDIMGKVNKWKGAFDTEYIGIIENQKLLSDYHQKIINLANQIESKHNQKEKSGIKLFLFSVAIIACNALITALIIKL